MTTRGLLAGACWGAAVLLGGCAAAVPPSQYPAEGSHGPPSIDPRELERLQGRADVLAHQGRFAEAMRLQQEVLSHEPKSFRSLLAVSELEGAQQHYEAELAWADRALEVRETEERAWLCRGRALVGLERPEEARGAFVEALTLEPRLLEAHLELGSIAQRDGDYVVAAEHFRRAVAAEPASETGWFNLGAVLEELGSFEDAAAALRHALILNPDATHARELLGRLPTALSSAR